MTDWYGKLGVRKIINAKGTSTGVGGSLMPPEVLAAMEDAAANYVFLDELQRKAGEYIARLTHNEACYICCGSSSGLLLAAAACMTGNDSVKIRQVPDTTGMPDEFIIHRSHMNPYARIIPVSGGKLVDVGFAVTSAPYHLEEAINENTAGIFYFLYRQGWRVEEAAITLEETIEIAHRHDVPVIVDAAGQLPPKENLWRFTEMGADLVVISGGKGLKGPQSSGLILGRSDLIEACQQLGPPNHNLGRAMKVPKEEIVGLVAAVERYLSMDHEKDIKKWEDTVAEIAKDLAEVDGLHAYSRRPGDSGEPFPFCEVQLLGPDSSARRDALVSALKDWDPAISVSAVLSDLISINALTLKEGEDRVLVDAIKSIMKEMDS